MKTLVLIAFALWGFTVFAGGDSPDPFETFQNAVERAGGNGNGTEKAPPRLPLPEEEKFFAYPADPDFFQEECEAHLKINAAVPEMPTGETLLLRRPDFTSDRREELQDIFASAGLRVLGVRPIEDFSRLQVLLQKAEPASGLETRIFNSSVVDQPGKFRLRYFKNRRTGESTEMLELSDPNLFTFAYYMEGRAPKVYLRPQVGGLPISEPLQGAGGTNYAPQPVTFGFSESEHPQRRVLRVLKTLAPNNLRFLPRKFEMEFYPSPDSLLVNARSFFIQLKGPLTRKIFDWEPWDAPSLIQRLQETAAGDGILELNLHRLLHATETPGPAWKGEPVSLAMLDNSRAPQAAPSLQLRSRRNWKQRRWFTPQGSERWTFYSGDIQEVNAQGAQTAMNQMEYAVSKLGSANQISLLPVKNVNNRIWVGLKTLDTPVAQMSGGGSVIWGLPTWRVYNGETSLRQAVKDATSRFERELDIAVNKVHALGASFRSDPEVSADLIYPYLAEVDPDTRIPSRLAWFPLDRLILQIDQIKDARLVLTLYRLEQAMQQAP